MDLTALGEKVILVMGGTTGLGLSATKAFVREGARVVVVGRSPESAALAVDELGEAVEAVVGDATDPLTAPRAIEQALSAWGRLDGLYHVAGGSGRRRGDGPLHELTDEGWDYTLDQNLRSVFLSNRAAVRYFLAVHSPGSILNMGSVLGTYPSPAYFSTHAYAAAKAAIVGMTRSAAAYYAPQNIRLNVIAPGLVATPMSARAQTDGGILSFVSTKQPLDRGRIGVPGDLDAAAVYFLSDASSFVTGQVLYVDGGWSVSEGQVQESA